MASKPSHERHPKSRSKDHIPLYPTDLHSHNADAAKPLQNTPETFSSYDQARGRFMNQSFISLIANVGSDARFNASLDNEWREDHSEKTPNVPFDLFPIEHETDVGLSKDDTITAHSNNARATLARKMLQSMPTLPKRHVRKRHKNALSDAMTASQFLLPPPNKQVARPYPLNQDMFTATAHESTSEQGFAEKLTELKATSEVSNLVELSIDNGVLDLPEVLMKIFGLKTREDLIAEYPCYLVQSSLLQGHIYILQKHVCFYAYLPKRSQIILRSGYISKRGRNNPKYNRYWFILKGDVLSYYTNAADLYFPRGTIDLRTAVSAQLAKGKEVDVSHANFTISTLEHNISFKAYSVTSAREWVKHIQSAIFRSQNGGDSIKIILPVHNILDLEINPVLDAADTFRLRVIDNDETYAVDEYFFTFFGCGPSALDALRTVIGETPLDSRKGTATLEPVREVNVVLDLPKTSPGRNSTEQISLSDVPAVKPLLLSCSALAPELSSEQQQSLVDSMANVTSQEPATNLGADRMIHDERNPIQRLSKDLLDVPIAGLISLPTEEAFEGSKSYSAISRNREDSSDETERSTIQHSSSYSRLQEVLRASAYPLQRASGIAGILRTKSQRVGNLLASESAGYYERAYSMWAGNRMHYDAGEGPATRSSNQQRKEHEVNHGERFRKHFAMPVTEKLQATYYSYLHRIIPIYGKIYLGTNKICFRSLLPGTRTKMILPLKDIENVVQEKGFRFGYAGLVITVRGHEEIFFEFRQSDARDDCAFTMLEMVEKVRHLHESRILTKEENLSTEAAKTEHELLQQARRMSQGRSDKASAMEQPDFAIEDLPILFDDPLASIVNFKPPEPLNITCLTIGSRGDVQPFIALCKGLIAEGHSPTIATHAEFGDWIKSHGINFVAVAGNPAEIMRLCVENDMFTVAFIREAHTKFRGFIGELLETAWAACQGSDLLIESPSAMAGIHIAEALQIPYFRAFTMPWTRTRAYPHAFAVPTQKLGGNYNMMTYVMFDNLFWQAMAGQINRWRHKTLGLRSTNMDRLQADKVPFLYNFSPAVVIPPLDFNHWIRITGYWFLDEGVEYTPQPQLAAFIRQARKDGKKLVYVGFGSVVVENPAELTKAVVEAVLQADVRCILSKGWSDRLDKEAAAKAEIPLPESILQIQSAPHDWLFRQVNAAAHHGGAGTTGASIRAGIPTITKPFFGDQYFFGLRIEDLGVGVCLPEITATGLADALIKATTDDKMIERARLLGEKIRGENGVQTAIQAIYRDLDYAKSLIKARTTADGVTDETEESWTMVGNEVDPDSARLLKGGSGPEFHSSLAQRRQSTTSGESILAQDDETSHGSSGDSNSDESNDSEANEEAGEEESDS